MKQWNQLLNEEYQRSLSKGRAVLPGKGSNEPWIMPQSYGVLIQVYSHIEINLFASRNAASQVNSWLSLK